MKRIDEEQRFREEREAEKRGREPRKTRRARRDLAGRDALSITLIERTAAVAENEPPEEVEATTVGERIPRDVAAENCWRAYTCGWRVGAGGGVPDHEEIGKLSYGPAYLDGCAAGLEAFNRAAHAASERYGYTPSVLRTEQTP